MCVTPYITQSRDGKIVAVPCGKCIQCLKDFQNEWSFRLTQECKRTILPLFITLTYNDEHLPLGEDEDGNIQSVLLKSDFQKFMKRFRRYNPQLSMGCRYFAVGEYGSKKNRCHFHAVLILPEIRLDNIKKQRLFLNYIYKRVLYAWSLYGKEIGFVKVSPCDDKQIRYVTKYMNKIDKRPHLVKPFRLMSKSIGLNYLTDAIVNYYLTTFDRTVVNKSARINMPKYYRDKLNQMSNRNWMLKRVGLVYSDLLPKPEYKEGSLRSTVSKIQHEFCENFDEFYRRCVAHIATMSRVLGYQVWEPNRNEVYRFFVESNKTLQDAIRVSDDAIKLSCINNDLNGYHDITYERLEYEDCC